MTVHRHYAKPPITEAVIDIRIQSAPHLFVSKFDGPSEQIKAEYPKRENITITEAQMTFGPEPSASATGTKIGYLFRSLDGKFIVQMRTNGFTLSRLAPYAHWDSLRDEARKLWNVYREAAQPVVPTRVAVRFINRIDIPLPMRDLSDYLRTFPEVSKDLPQLLNGYLMQLLIALEQGTMLSLIQATVPAPNPQVSSISLDIDIFKESPAEFDSDEKVWEFLESLRDKKNEVFEGCITNKSRSLFELIQA